MKLVLSNEEKLQFFYTALCNSLGYMRGYDLELNYNQEEYDEASLKLTNPCYEDVLIQMLKDGKGIFFADLDFNELTYVFLTDVYKRIDLVEADVLLNFSDEQDDALDGDILLQTVFFGEVIYG